MEGFIPGCTSSKKGGFLYDVSSQAPVALARLANPYPTMTMITAIAGFRHWLA